MKKALYIKALILFCSITIHSSVVAQGQIGHEGEDPLQTQLRGTNMIAHSSYNAITYNGYTISQIEATEGNANNLSQLFGNPTFINDDNAIIREFTYVYGTNKVTFMGGELTRIDIKENTWPVTVLGKTIRVGDSFSDMKQKFGNDLKIIYMPSIDADYTVSFGNPGNDGDGTHINFSTSTNKVVDIVYFVNI